MAEGYHQDKSMGAAAVRLPLKAEDKYAVQSSSFRGPISSTSAELRGLTLAQTLIGPVNDKKNWKSLSLPPRLNPELGLFRTFGVDLSTSPG